MSRSNTATNIENFDFEDVELDSAEAETKAASAEKKRVMRSIFRNMGQRRKPWMRHSFTLARSAFLRFLLRKKKFCMPAGRCGVMKLPASE